MPNTQQANGIQTAFEGIINDWGSSIDIISKSSPSRDDFGQLTYGTTSTTSTVGVFDTYAPKRLQFERSGKLKEGEIVIILKGTETISEDNYIQTNGVEYNIVSIEETKVADVTIVKQVTVAKVE